MQSIEECAKLLEVAHSSCHTNSFPQSLTPSLEKKISVELRFYRGEKFFFTAPFTPSERHPLTLSLIITII